MAHCAKDGGTAFHITPRTDHFTMYGTAGGGGGYRDDAYAGSQAEPLTGGGARRRQVRAGT